MEKLDRIQINPKICLGQPVVRGTRITVSVILKLLASGQSVEELDRSTLPSIIRKLPGMFRRQ